MHSDEVKTIKKNSNIISDLEILISLKELHYER